MNFKKLSRSLVCLLLVVCMLVAVSPIQAEATGAGLATTWAAFAVAPEIAISAAMIALGVTVVAGSAVVLGSVVSECEQFLVENGYISGELVDVYRADADSRIQYMISRDLVQVIREWLFDSGKLTTKTAIAGADITVTTIGSSGLSGLVNNSPENTMALFKGLGVGDKVLIVGCDADYLYGYYFDGYGILQCGKFVNSLGQKHATLLGTYAYGSLSHVSSIQCGNYYWIYPRTDYDYPIFYDISYAQKHPDYLTMSCLAIDWDTLFNYNSSAGSLCFGFFQKYSSDSVFQTNVITTIAVKGCGEASIGSFTWGTTTQSVVSTDLNLNVSGVATPDKSFSEGYSDWASGAKSLPTLRNGEISDAESMYLSLGMADTLEETMALIQSQAQGGTITDSGTTSDAVTATGLKGWLDTIRLSLVDGFTALKDGFKAVISALADLPALIAGIFRTLASHFKSIFLLGTLLEVLGEFLQALFGWLPESMFMVLMLTFGVAIFYKFIGR